MSRSAPIALAEAGMLTLALWLGACSGGAPARPPSTPTTTPSESTRPRAAGSRAARPGHGRPPNAIERGMINRLVMQTAAIRGLSLERPVPVEIQDGERISAELLEQLDEEDLAQAELLYPALGLLDPSLDLRALLQSVLAEQVVGFFDPEEERLVVREDVFGQLRTISGGEGGDEARIVLVHELVHALQAQRLGLVERFEEERDADADNAFRSVIEGDATLAMLGFIVAEQGGSLEQITGAPGRLRSMLDAAGPVPGDRLSTAPTIIRVSLVAPYLEGAVFCSDLHRLGGWEAVNEAHSDPPTSTEQILHLEKYLSDERPDPIELPPLPHLEAAGFSPGEENTLGELELGVYLGQGRPDGLAPEVAVGWSGDRVRTYTHADRRTGVVWYTAWDDRSSARRVERRARDLLRGLPTSERMTHTVTRRGRAILIARHIPAALHPPLIEAFDVFAGQLPEHPPQSGRARALHPARP